MAEFSAPCSSAPTSSQGGAGFAEPVAAPVCECGWRGRCVSGARAAVKIALLLLLLLLGVVWMVWMVVHGR